jgi:transcriptional regulator with XRE-family HTH domain
MTADDLRHLRALLRLTQAELAAKLYLHANTVARMERGELPIGRQTEALVRLLVRE